MAAILVALSSSDKGTATDRVGRLGPALDDVANDVEQDRGAVLEATHRCGAFAVPTEQRDVLRVCPDQQLRQHACDLVVGGSPLGIEAEVNLDDPRANRGWQRVQPGAMRGSPGQPGGGRSRQEGNESAG